MPKQHGNEARAQVVALRQAHHSYAQIERQLHVPGRTARRIWSSFKLTNSWASKHRLGRPPKLTRIQRDSIARKLGNKRTGTLRKATLAARATGVAVSKSTVHRLAHLAGLQYRKRRPKPLLTAAHKLARLRFARRRWTMQDWKRTVFCDESGIRLYLDTPGAWVRDGEEPDPKDTKKYQPSIKVWAAVSWNGKTNLIKVEKNMRADNYIDLLRTELLPWANAAHPAGWKLLHDGDGSHTAAKTRKWIKDEKMDVIDPWPAHSPDLNIIENVWGMLKERLGYLDIRSIDELWRSAQSVWNQIGLQEVRNCVESMPRRLRAVVEAQGGHTKY